MNNPWYARLIHTTEHLAKRLSRLGKPYSVAITVIGGILDVLQSSLGANPPILALYRQPNLIDTCRAIILEKLT
jgi:hypothetical protein